MTYTKDGLIVVPENKILAVREDFLNKLENFREQVVQKFSLIKKRNDALIEENSARTLSISENEEFDVSVFEYLHFIAPYELLGGLEREDFPIVSKETIDSVNQTIDEEIRRTCSNSAVQSTYSSHANDIRNENPYLTNFCLGVSRETYGAGKMLAILGVMKFVHNYEFIRAQAKIDRQRANQTAKGR